MRPSSAQLKSFIDKLPEKERPAIRNMGVCVPDTACDKTLGKPEVQLQCSKEHKGHAKIGQPCNSAVENYGCGDGLKCAQYDIPEAILLDNESSDS